MAQKTDPDSKPVTESAIQPESLEDPFCSLHGPITRMREKIRKIHFHDREIHKTNAVTSSSSFRPLLFCPHSALLNVRFLSPSRREFLFSKSTLIHHSHQKPTNQFRAFHK